MILIADNKLYESTVVLFYPDERDLEKLSELGIEYDMIGRLDILFGSLTTFTDESSLCVRKLISEMKSINKLDVVSVYTFGFYPTGNLFVLAGNTEVRVDARPEYSLFTEDYKIKAHIETETRMAFEEDPPLYSSEFGKWHYPKTGRNVLHILGKIYARVTMCNGVSKNPYENIQDYIAEVGWKREVC